MISFRAFCWLSTLFSLCFLSQVVLAETPISRELGRSIYETGIGRDGRAIHARMHGNVTLSGAVIACINCHGKDGRGGGEAFIRVPDIRWFNLSKSFTSRRTGAAEPAYDRASFTQAVRLGISPSGRKLDPVMPRTDLANDEIDGLIDYLTHIDQTVSSGLSFPVVLGLLPKPGINIVADTLGKKLANCSLSKSGSPVSAIDIIYFDTPDDAIHQLKEKLKQTPNALILAPFLIGWESHYVQAMQQERAKTILPFSQLDPVAGSRWYFHFPGLKAQILALLQSAKRDGYTHLQIEYQPDQALSAALHDFARQTAKQIGITVTETDQSADLSRLQSARLWLRAVNANEIIQQHRQNTLLLAPGLFFTPLINITPEQRKFPGWRIAYPYAPYQHNNTDWITPADAWATAACEFLVGMGTGSIDQYDLGNSSLQSWPLTATPTMGESAAQVYLHESAIK